jgi:hypothetical protein
MASESCFSRPSSASPLVGVLNWAAGLKKE